MKKKVLLVLLIALALVGVSFVTIKNGEEEKEKPKTEKDIKDFSLTDKGTFTVDEQGRVSSATAVLGADTISDYEAKVDVSYVPAGFDETAEHEGEKVYSKCLLMNNTILGYYQIENNIYTGTQDLKKEVKKYENKIYDYIYETGNHVFYRVKPIYGSDKELIPRSISMEAYSFEDSGDGLSFKVTCDNKQSDIEISYTDGKIKEK